MGVLSKADIEACLRSNDENRRLYITPLLESSQICAASVDVRLGPEMIVLERSRVAVLDLGNPLEAERASARKIYVGYRNPFILHPGELVLAATLEYVKLPTTVSAEVVGRSSFGRTGLIIATATRVHPGYCGCITLEIENLGPVPIRIFPGVRIAQLVLHHVNVQNEERYEGKYCADTGPAFGRLSRDKDLLIFRPPTRS